MSPLNHLDDFEAYGIDSSKHAHLCRCSSCQAAGYITHRPPRPPALLDAARAEWARHGHAVGVGHVRKMHKGLVAAGAAMAGVIGVMGFLVLLPIMLATMAFAFGLALIALPVGLLACSPMLIRLERDRRHRNRYPPIEINTDWWRMHPAHDPPTALERVRRDYCEGRTNVIEFLLRVDELFEFRKAQITDWETVDPWTDPLEPRLPPPPMRRAPDPLYKAKRDSAREFKKRALSYTASHPREEENSYRRAARIGTAEAVGELFRVKVHRLASVCTQIGSPNLYVTVPFNVDGRTDKVGIKLSWPLTERNLRRAVNELSDRARLEMARKLGEDSYAYRVALSGSTECE